LKYQFYEFDAYPSLIIFSKDETILKTVESVAKIYSEKDDINFFHSSKTIHVHGHGCSHGHDHDDSSHLSPFVSAFFGISKLPILVYITPNLDTRYLFSGEYTKENIVKFLEDSKSGKLNNYMRSGERLENDKHPRLPGLYHIVNSTFDTFITNSKDDFLLIAHASYQFDPTILFYFSRYIERCKII